MPFDSVVKFHPCENKGLQTTKIEDKSEGENQRLKAKGKP